MEFLSNNFISEFFVLCLSGLQSFFEGLGPAWSFAIAIIVLTIFIRAAMLPLDIKQRKNQRKMSQMSVEVENMKKRYANNPQQLQKKQQEMYKKMGINPMLGCLPALIQLPILFAFFGAMRVLASEQIVGLVLNAAQYGPDAVVLPNFMWIHNFWMADSGLANILPNYEEFLGHIQQNASYITPQALMLLKHQGLITFQSGVLEVVPTVYDNLAYNVIDANGLVGFRNGWFILPVISGAALFLQQKFGGAGANPTGVDPTGGANPQNPMAGGKFMLWFFPLFSIYICMTSNTAFTLYWIMSSLYAFGQSKLIDYVRNRKEGNQKIVIAK